MAEFSKEYFEFTNQDLPGDFSYKEEFAKLQENECFYEICEGFGTIGITRKNDKMYVILKNEQDPIEFSFFIIEKQN